MLNIVIGSPGAGKSHTLYNKLIDESINNPDNRFVLFVPDQYSLEAQKEIMSLHPKKGALNIEVSSFNRMAYEVLEEQGISKLSMMDDLKKSIVIRKALLDCQDDLNVFRRKVNMPGFTEKVKSLMSELGQYNITDDVLFELTEQCQEKTTLKYKIEDIIVIKHSIEKYIDDKSLTSEELQHKFIDAIPKSDIVANTYFYFDGFTGFTPIQVEVISALMNHAKDVTTTVTLPTDQCDLDQIASDDLFYLSKSTIRDLKEKAEANNVQVNITNVENQIVSDKDAIITSRPYRIKDNEPLAFVNQHIFNQNYGVYKKNQDAIKLVESNSLENEVLAVARRISRLVKREGYQYGDFAVICPNMEVYYKYIENIFDVYDIPAFIDYKRSTATNLFMDLLIALIRVKKLGFDYASLFHLLRLDLSPINEDDLDYIENYIITMRRTSFNSFAHEWKREMRSVDIDRVNSIREQIHSCFSAYNSAMTKAQTVEDYCVALYSIIKEWKIAEQLSDYTEYFEKNKQVALAEEYSQMYASIIKLLDTIVASLGDEKMDLDDFERLVLAGIETLKIGVIPPSVDDVMVGDIERTRLKDTKKVLFLIGANEGNIPKEGNIATIINDNDRDFLKQFDVELAPTTLENVYKQQFYLYALLAKPTEQFIVSYSTIDNTGDSIKKSYFVESLNRMFKELKIEREYGEETGVDDIYNERLALQYMASKKDLVRNHSMSQDEEDIYSSVKHLLNQSPKYRELADNVYAGTFYKFSYQSIEEAVARKLYDGGAISITRAQNQVKCPYRQFMQNGLRLKDRQVYTLESYDVGNIEHKVFETFFGECISDNVDLDTIEKTEIDSRIEKSVDDAINEYSNEYVRENYNKKFIRRQLTEMAKESTYALINHLRLGKFQISSMESRDSSGIADRIDTAVLDDKVLVKVIDYKTFPKEVKYGNILSGYDMQTLVYLKDAIDRERAKKENAGKEIVPAGAYYFTVNNPQYSKPTQTDQSLESLMEKAKESNYSMTGLTNETCQVELGINENINIVQTSRNKVNKEFVLDNSTYNRLLEAVMTKLGDVRENIRSGHIESYPCEGVCSYCDYKNICKFEMSDDEPRIIKKVKKDELEDEISQILEEDE